MVRYILYGLVTTILIFFLILIFASEIHGMLSILSLIPVAIYTLIYKKERGSLPLKDVILWATIVFFIASFTANSYPYTVIIAILGFSMAGLFILLWKIVSS